MRWAEQQRHEFIAETLRKAHAINRSDLMSKFGISLPQASIDLNKFLREHPKAMVYDRSAKRYVVPSWFCTRDSVEVYERRCPHCGKLKSEKS